MSKWQWTALGLIVAGLALASEGTDWRSGRRIVRAGAPTPRERAPALAPNRDWILLAGAAFDPEREMPRPPAGHGFARQRTDDAGRGLFLVQWRSTPGPAERGKAGTHGLDMLRILPGNVCLVAGDGGRVGALRADSGVRWAGPMEPFYKVDAALLRDRFEGSQFLEAVLVADGDEAGMVRAAQAAAPSARPAATIRQAWGLRVRLRVDGGEVAAAAVAMANHPWTEAVSLWRLPEVVNDQSIWVVQNYDTANRTNYALSATIWNKGILGTNQIVCVNDSGLDSDMCFFKYTAGGFATAQTPTPPATGTLVMSNKVIGYAVIPGAAAYDVGSVSFHGTHVSGSVLGDNLLTLSTSSTHGHDTGDGMAPNAKLYLQDVGDASGSLAGLSGDLYQVSQQAYNAGAFCQSDSWGGQDPAGPVPYSSDAVNMDLFTFNNEEFLHIVAAGNTSGGPYVGTPAIAKNIITVGATTNGTGNSTAMAGFSSVGPAADGRIKPDISAPGEDIVSASGNATSGDGNCTTKLLSGTSMATPTMSGATALVRQYFTDGFYPTGAKTPADAFTPSGALLKAVLINGADDLGTANVPNGNEGWGRIHLDNALFFTGDARRLRVWDKRNAAGLTTGQQDEFTVSVGAGSALRVTLVWSDPPASLAAGTDLVNNLDLEVVGPSGTYKGNVLASGVSTTGGSADVLNNVEQVLLAAPGAGTWTLRVKGTAVPGNGFTPESDHQGYALVATWADCGSGPAAAPGGMAATDNTTTGIGLSWTAAAGATGYEIYRAAGTCGAPGTFGYLASTASLAYMDATVQGGYTYAYKVRAVNACHVGAWSACASATYTGNCTLAPAFAGVTSVTNNTGTAVCDLTLTWGAATSRCPLGTAIAYNIYRSTTPYFTPGAANRVATDVTGVSWTDGAVEPLTTYWYVVRAEDGTAANGGPSNGGNEEGNLRLGMGTAWGSTSTPASFVDDGGDTNAKLAVSGAWRVTNTQNHTGGGTFAYHSGDDNSNYPPGACAAIMTPPLALQAGAPTLTYWARFNIEWQWDGVVVEVSNNGGASWTPVAPNGGWPGDFSTGGGVTSPINGCLYSLTQGCINGPSGNAALSPWTQYTHDLSAYAGQTVLIRWNFSSDGGLEFEGFFLDDIQVTLASTPDTCQISDGKVAILNDPVRCGGSANVHVMDSDLLGDGSVSVTLASPTEPAGESLLLIESPADSGVFLGSLPLVGGASPPANGALGIADGQVVTVTYVDADDGMGGINQPKTDTATADCLLPVISNVLATSISSTSAVITWTTNEPADSRVSYGTSPPPGTNLSSATPGTSHSMPVTGLTPCTTYVFSVASQDPAGNLATADNGGAYFSFTTLADNQPSVASTDTPIAIPDNNVTGITSTIAVANTRIVQDVNVTLNITHPYVGDLVVELTPPGGSPILLVNKRGGSGDNFTQTVFDDEAVTGIAAGAAPFTGSFKPESPLTGADGISANGNWALRVSDQGASDLGSLQSWTLGLTVAPYACGPAASLQGTALVGDVCASGGAGNANGVRDAGEYVQFSVTLLNSGSGQLTGVSATLEAVSAGVGIADGSAAFADLPIAGYAASAAPHYTVRLDDGIACGSAIDFLLHVASAQGSWTLPFSWTTGNVTSPSATPLNEGFAGGIPGTWTVVNGGSGGGAAATWTSANPGARAAVAPMAAPFAIVDSDNAGSGATQDEELITPVLDLSAATSATLEFDQYFRYYTTEIGDVDVRSSLTGGAWVNVLRNQGASSLNPEHRTLNVSAQAAGASDVQVRFHYYNAGYEWYWMVDNVKVTMTQTPVCSQNVCGAAPPPPPVPDGLTGSAMTATRLNAAGTQIGLTWDTATCSASGYHLVYGDLAAVSGLSPAGGLCTLAGGAATWNGAPAGDLWFLLVGDNGANLEGSWGEDSAGLPIGSGASNVCGMSSRDTSGICP